MALGPAILQSPQNTYLPTSQELITLQDVQLDLLFLAQNEAFKTYKSSHLCLRTMIIIFYQNFPSSFEQLQLLQSSSMASSQASMQSSLTGIDQLSIASSQGLGITSVQNPQQVIRSQQPNITYQIQRSQASNVGIVSASSVINTKMLGQANPQLVASNQNVVASQAGITVVAGMPVSGTKSPIVNVAVSKPQMVVQRTQTQIRPTTAINIVSNASNGASLIQQQQLRMMGITAGK